MTPASIITETLRSVPAPVRRVLLAGWALGVVVLGVLAIAEVPTGWVPDAWLYIGGYLGVQSAANVEPGRGRRIKRD